MSDVRHDKVITLPTACVAVTAAHEIGSSVPRTAKDVMRFVDHEPRQSVGPNDSWRVKGDAGYADGAVLIEVGLETGGPSLRGHGAQRVKDTFVCQTDVGQRKRCFSTVVIPGTVNRKW